MLSAVFLLAWGGWSRLRCSRRLLSHRNGAVLELQPPGKGLAILACLAVVVPIIFGDIFATTNLTLEHFAPPGPSDVPQAKYLNSLEVRGQLAASGILFLAVIK